MLANGKGPNPADDLTVTLGDTREGTAVAVVVTAAAGGKGMG